MRDRPAFVAPSSAPHSRPCASSGSTTAWLRSAGISTLSAPADGQEPRACCSMRSARSISTPLRFLHGQRRTAFEDALIVRQRSTARNAWIFLALGALFFLGWLYRLMTMTWTANATLTALQFTPACAVFFLLAFRFGLENYQIRMRRKVTVMEYLSAPRGFWPR